MSIFKIGDWVLDDEDNLFQVTRVRDDEIALGDEPYYVPAKEFRLKEQDDEDNRLSSDIDTTVDNSGDSDNGVSKMTIPIIEVDEEMDREIDEYYTTYRWVYKREEFVKSHRQGFKLVTEDNCTLIRSMF